MRIELGKELPRKAVGSILGKLLDAVPLAHEQLIDKANPWNHQEQVRSHLGGLAIEKRKAPGAYSGPVSPPSYEAPEEEPELTLSVITPLSVDGTGPKADEPYIADIVSESPSPLSFT